MELALEDTLGSACSEESPEGQVPDPGSPSKDFKLSLIEHCGALGILRFWWLNPWQHHGVDSVVSHLMDRALGLSEAKTLAHSHTANDARASGGLTATPVAPVPPVLMLSPGVPGPGHASVTTEPS